MKKDITKQDLITRQSNTNIKINVHLFDTDVLIDLLEKHISYLFHHYDEDTKEEHDRIVDECHEFIRDHGLIHLFTSEERDKAIRMMKIIHDIPVK